MNDDAAISMGRQPMLSDVLLALLAMALFLFALQPREHAHGSRRREADAVSDVHSAPAGPPWHRYEAEALEAVVIQTAFEASL